MSIRPRVPELNFTELDRDGVAEVLKGIGEPRFRADQIYKWIFARGARSFRHLRTTGALSGGRSDAPSLIARAPRS